MRKMNIVAYLSIAAVVGATLVWVAHLPTNAREKSEKPIEVRWLLAHGPTDLFARATETFAEVLKKETDGEMTLTVLTASDIDSEVGLVGDVPVDTVLSLLEDGDIELSSTLAVGVGNHVPGLLEVNLPFLFDGLDEAFAALDGPEGDALLTLIAKHTDARGLAFTLSGGFRILVSHKDLNFRSIDDLKEKTIITTAGVVGEETFRQLGAKTFSNPTDIDQLPDAEDIDAVEVSYTRISALENPTFIKHVVETNHSLFLTIMLTSKSFYDSLSSRHRAAFEKAALAAAAVEREDSIALGEKVKQTLKEKGVVIAGLPPEVRTDFTERTLPTYEWFEKMIGPRIVK